MREYIIACVPPPDVTARALHVSRALQSYGGLFVLKSTSERPHVTLYYTVLPRGVVRDVRTQLATIARRTAPFAMTATRFTSQNTWVDVEYRRSQALLALQRDVIASVNPLRGTHMRERDAERLATASPAVRRNIEQYGYRSVGAQYRPHLTFTRLQEEQDVRSSFADEQARAYSFRVTTLGLYGTGAHGTCVRLLSSFALGK
ncbi:MAG: 2'-5' RNA ligase family protein [bacterium]|nr:2'-5' RNA ligase family protein [bacterium]